MAKKQVAEYWKKRDPKKVAEIIAYADMFCRHEFLFNTENDLEQMDEPIIYGKKIDWEYKPGDDQEYIYQFNRHRYFITLGQAYQLTGEEKYAECYVDMLTDWIRENPLCEEKKNTSWRILEAGFRGEYWTKAFDYFKDSKNVTAEVVAMYENCLHEHAKYLVSMHSPYRMISNWGVIENHGLFCIAIALLENPETEVYLKTAIEHLEILSRMAVMPDGVEWEQSPMYHNEVLKCFLEVVMLAKEHDISLPETIVDCVRRMAWADLIWQKPNHYEFMMGDSDDFDISPFLCRAAYCFMDGTLKYGAKPEPDYETSWEIGMEGIESYLALEAKEPEFTSKALEESGNFYLRSGWEEDANLLHFHCGTLGAGHGHSDKLHVDLVVKGEDVLMDGGRYTYVYGEKRREYKEPTMHNTITVDGEFFTICKDSWECTKLSQPVNQQFVAGEKYEFVQGGHLGYMDRGVFVNRKIVYLRPNVYVIVDECYAGDKHIYESYFHFNNQGSLALEKLPGTSGSKVIYEGNRAQAQFFFLSEGVKAEKIATHIARKYNHEEDNETIKLSWNGEGFTSNMTVIVTGDKAEMPQVSCEKIPVKSCLKQITYPNSMAEAVKVTLDGKEYVIIVCHQEVNSPTDLVEADGCLGFGNVIVFDKEEATNVGHTLMW